MKISNSDLETNIFLIFGLKGENSGFSYWNVNNVNCVLQIACLVPELEIISLVIHCRACLVHLWTLTLFLFAFFSQKSMHTVALRAFSFS